MMKRNILLLLLCLTVAACNNKMKEENGDTSTTAADEAEAEAGENPEEPRPDHWLKKSREGVYFTAGGNEPFWSLDLDRSGTITYRTPENMEGLTFAAPQPNTGRDSETIRYATSQDNQVLELVLRQTNCTDGMSGLESPFQVELTIGPTDNPRSLSGCGRFIGDYRLHDIWVLTEMAGSPISKEQFPGEAPSLELKLGANAAMGNAGCNRYRGPITFVQQSIAFGPVMSTKMACPAMEAESQYLGILSAGPLPYELANGTLTLGTGDQKLVYKKVD